MFLGVFDFEIFNLICMIEEYFKWNTFKHANEILILIYNYIRYICMQKLTTRTQIQICIWEKNTHLHWLLNLLSFFPSELMFRWNNVKYSIWKQSQKNRVNLSVFDGWYYFQLINCRLFFCFSSIWVRLPSSD